MAAPVWCTRKITPSTEPTEKRPQMSAVSAEVIEPVPAIVIAAQHRHGDDRGRVVADQEEAREDQHPARVDRRQHGPAPEPVPQRSRAWR